MLLCTSHTESSSQAGCVSEREQRVQRWLNSTLLLLDTLEIALFWFSLFVFPLSFQSQLTSPSGNRSTPSEESGEHLKDLSCVLLFFPLFIQVEEEPVEVGDVR